MSEHEGGPPASSAPARAQGARPRGMAEPADRVRGPGIAPLALAGGLGLMLLITAYPRVLATPDGRADHLAATLACWAMAAGLTRGVGYVPVHAVPRWLLGGAACALALGLAVARLVLLHR